MIVVYLLAGIIALFLLIAAIVGTKWSYEKSILIEAPVATVWDKIKSLHALNQWNPWVGKDPNVKIAFSSEDGVPGATYSWDSEIKQVGAGSQTILNITEQQEMATRVDFLRPFKGTGNALVRLTKDRGYTKVTWSMHSSTPYPMNIIKLLGVIKKNMDKDFSAGLHKLKDICVS